MKPNKRSDLFPVVIRESVSTPLQGWERLTYFSGFRHNFLCHSIYKGRSLSVFRGFPFKLHQFVTLRPLAPEMEPVPATDRSSPDFVPAGLPFDWL